MTFRVVPWVNDPSVASISWEGETDQTAEDLLAAEREKDDESGSAIGEAVAFLRTVLKEGPLLAKQVFSQAKEQGIAQKTLKRAKARLKVKSEKLEGHPGTPWRLETAVRRTIARGPECGLVERDRVLGAFGLLGPLLLTLRTHAPCLTLLLALLGGLLTNSRAYGAPRDPRSPREPRDKGRPGSPHGAPPGARRWHTATRGSAVRLEPRNQVWPSVPLRTAKPRILSGIASTARRAPGSALGPEESFRPTARTMPVKGFAGQPQ